MPEILVTIVVLQTTTSGSYDRREFPGVTVNTQAPDHLVLKGLVDGLQRYKIDLDPKQTDMFIQGSTGASLDNYIQNGSKIILMPKFIAPPVKFPDPPSL